MSKQAIKQLKSKDSDTRKTAIRSVARAKERGALKQLAIMAGDDPDAEVRKLAKKAGVYIRQELGEIPKQDSNGTSNGAQAYNVSERAQAQAQRYVEAAMTANLSGDTAQVMKLLHRALTYNPNLRDNDYFISLSEDATGLEGQGAVDRLGDEERLRESEAEQARKREQQAAADHMEKVNAVGWRDVVLDLSMVTVIAMLGALISLFVATQRADAFHAGHQADLEQVQTLPLHMEDGQPVLEDGCNLFVVSPAEDATGEPETMREPTCDYNSETPYWDVNAYWRDVSAGQIVGPGVAIGLGVPLLILLAAGVGHVIARTVFRGEGSLPYYAHQIGGLMSNRLLIVAGLALVSAYLYFTIGSYGGVFLGVVGGAAGLFALQAALKTAGAYRLSTALGLITGLVGSGVAAAAGAAGGLLIF